VREKLRDIKCIRVVVNRKT